MSQNNRKHERFSATAFLNMPVVLEPLIPFFGEKVTGKLIDLSAGGMALLLDEEIPADLHLALNLRFPDRTELQSKVEVKHVRKRDGKYLHGFEFLNLPAYMADKIENMSSDYIDCEGRISMGREDVCQTNCSFYNMCTKKQRREPVFNVDVALELAFRQLEDSPLRATKLG